MKMSYNKKTSTLYIAFKKGKVYKTVEKTSDVLIDLDKDGNMVGVEFLRVPNAPTQKKAYKDLINWTKKFIERYRKSLEVLADE